MSHVWSLSDGFFAVFFAPFRVFLDCSSTVTASSATVGTRMCIWNNRRTLLASLEQLDAVRSMLAQLWSLWSSFMNLGSDLPKVRDCSLWLFSLSKDPLAPLCEPAN